MRRIIYADNAATTRISEHACEVMIEYLKNNYANISQPYSFARKPKKALKDARECIASCIGAEADEIYFTSCGSESNNWVIKNIPANKIITSQIEHHSILNACEAEKRKNKEIVYLPVTKTGIIESQILRNHLTRNCLVSIMCSNNEIGTIEPIQDLAYITHQYDSLFHTDGVQSIGHIKINVKELDVDFLSASAHKFNGPKGIGFLYKKRGIELPSLINGGAQEMSLRAGTEDVASIIAMSIALKENIDNLELNYQHKRKLELLLISLLEKSGILYIRNGDDNHIYGNISLSFPGIGGETLLHRMDLLGICISTGSACDSKETKISHVLRAIKLEDRFARGTIRISLDKDNTEEDVINIVNALIKIIK